MYSLAETHGNDRLAHHLGVTVIGLCSAPLTDLPGLADSLDRVKGGEEHHLRLGVLAQLLQVRLDHPQDIFTVLYGIRRSAGEPTRRSPRQHTLAIPRAINSRTTEAPSRVCTISARLSSELSSPDDA